MPDDRIDKAVKDPSFLALSPDDQVSVLQHYKDNPVQAAPEGRPGGLIPPPSPQGNTEWTGTKIARGAEMGVAQGLGIPTDTEDPSEVVTGAVKNTAKGFWNLGSAAVQDAGSLIVDPFLPKEQRQGDSKLYQLGAGVVGGMGDAFGAGWKALKEKDPEAAAQGFANFATQVLTLATLRKGKAPEIAPEMRQARLSNAIGGGGANHLALEQAMPQIVDAAKSADINSVKDLGKVINDAHTAVNDQFNAGFDPIKSKRVVPMSISKRILSLITPNMAQTAAGMEKIQKIKNAAVEYQKDWSLDELNHERMDLDKNLSAHYNKDSAGRYADSVNVDIDEAARKGAADVVYDEWGKANPGQDVRTLKQQHGALWQLDDAINGTPKGALNTLKAGQSDFKAEGGRASAFRPRITAGGHGVHGYLAGFADKLFNGGPMDSANRMVRGAFTPSLTQRAAQLGKGMFPAAHQLTPPPVPDEQQ